MNTPDTPKISLSAAMRPLPPIPKSLYLKELASVSRRFSELALYQNRKVYEDTVRFSCTGEVDDAAEMLSPQAVCGHYLPHNMVRRFLLGDLLADQETTYLKDEAMWRHWCPESGEEHTE